MAFNRVCANYTECKMFFTLDIPWLFLIVTCVDQNRYEFDMIRWLSNKNGTVYSISTWWTFTGTGWSKLCIFQQKGINLGIIQHCLHLSTLIFLKIFLKKMISILQRYQICNKLWYYIGCAQLIHIVQIHIYIFFTRLIHPGYSKQYVDQNRCESTGQDLGFQIEIGTSHSMFIY